MVLDYAIAANISIFLNFFKIKIIKKFDYFDSNLFTAHQIIIFFYVTQHYQTNPKYTCKIIIHNFFIIVNKIKLLNRSINY